MDQPPDRKRMKGMGRVAFLAQLDPIKAELDAGWPIKAVFQKRTDKLAMSYAQFARYVDKLIRSNQSRRFAADAPSPPPTSQQSPPLPAPPTPALPATTPTTALEESANAGHQPARSFVHDPIERPGDRERLLGEDWKR
jgi:hypothetical protein